MKKKKLSILLVLMLVMTIFTILEINIFHENGWAKGGQVMNNGSEKFFAAAVKNLNITVIYDNNPYIEGLSTAWGFSCLIRGTEKTILFDTGGNGTILLANMERLGIDPGKIDIVVLSHIHGDHVGGLEKLLEKNKNVTIYLPGSFPNRFKDGLKSAGIKITEVQGFTKICEDVYSTGELGTWIKEQSLIIHTDKGIILITGCSHPGIVKIITKATELIRDDVLFVMGGFHLAGIGKSELGEILHSFRKLKVKHVAPCHCSGDLARQMFKKEFHNNYINVGVGRVIQFK
ncbi:MAG: MBL fold metallo-hydrolase [Desulfobacterales bacterium S5133MH16]|nr:MAG: MBL fold metallo-hydrolase [Desulfobacterales bacterium S5133MH16]